MNRMERSGRRATLKALGIAAAAAGLHATGTAQTRKDALRIVVGIAPGGVSDTAARALAPAFDGVYASATVVENRTGAGGQLAVSAMRDAAPDGAIAMLTPASVLTVYPHTYRQLSYEPFKDLAPVGLTGRFEFGFGVGPMVPDSVKTLDDFFAWCRANPAKASFGSPAAGSIPHFIGILVGRAGGIDLVHVPYRGTQPALIDLVGGQIAAASGPVGGFVKQVEAGKCRLLATSGERRSRFTPSVPTYAELGFPDIRFDEWLGCFMPGTTSNERIEAASAVIRQAMNDAKVQGVLAAAGIDPVTSTPAELARLLRSDHDRWKEIVQSIGFEMKT